MNTARRLATRQPPVTWGRMTMCDVLGASHAFLERPGMLRLLLRGQSFKELVEEGGRALGTRLSGKIEQSASGPWFAVEIQAEGQVALLAAWLNRLLNLAGRDAWAPVECEVIQMSETGLHARVRGMPLSEKPRFAKAVILPCSLCAPGRGWIQVEVILEPSRSASRHRFRRVAALATTKGRG